MITDADCTVWRAHPPIADSFRVVPNGPELTIGDDPETAAAMEWMGARHTVCPASGYHVDAALKLVSTWLT